MTDTIILKSVPNGVKRAISNAFIVKTALGEVDLGEMIMGNGEIEVTEVLSVRTNGVIVPIMTTSDPIQFVTSSVA